MNKDMVTITKKGIQAPVRFRRMARMFRGCWRG